MDERSAGKRRLDALLRAASPLALAFSGGLDSRFLAGTALAGNGVRIHLYMFQGPHMRGKECAEAESWARARGFALTTLFLDPLRLPELRANKDSRCYHCKRAMFSALRDAALKHPPFPGHTLTFCDGGNLSDREEYRPGLRALQELGVRSFLAEAGLGKADIRILAEDMALDRPEQKARPCLLTRYAYGLEPDHASLSALGEAEDTLTDILEKALRAGEIAELPDFRLRLIAKRQGEPAYSRLAAFTVELHLEPSPLPESLREGLAAAVGKAGFTRPRLVELARVSGFYDRSGSEGGAPPQAPPAGA